MELAAPTFVKSAADKEDSEADELEEGGENRRGPAKEERSKGPGAKSPRRGEAARTPPKKSAAAGSAAGQRGGGGGYETELALATAELALEVKAEAREMKGYLEHTALVPASVKMVTAALAEGVAYNKETLAKKGQDIGSAHGKIATAGLQGLSTMDEVVGTPLEKSLQEFWISVVAKGLQQVEQEVHVFKVAKPKVPSKKEMKWGEEPYARVTFSFAPMTPRSSLGAQLEGDMLDFFKARNWEVESGTPPRSMKERKVADLAFRIRS